MNNSTGSNCSQRELLAAWKRAGGRLKKRLGQHVLTDPHTARRIVDAAGALAGRTVVEVGPGLGALTEHLAGRAQRLIGVELDAALHQRLAARFAGRNDVTLLRQDILAFDFAGLRDVVVVGAIPYQITSPLLRHLTAHHARISDAWLVIQREVAQRLAAGPGTKAYGRLSCAVQYWAAPRLCFIVKPGAFTPPPQVDSALVHLAMRRTPAVRVQNEARFFEVIAAAFGHRRKTLLNCLLMAPALRDRREAILQALAAAELQPTQRGETVSLAQFARLTDALFGRSASD